MKASEILRAAKELIQEPEHWCTRMYAADKDRRSTDIFGSNVVAWCMVGALYKVVGCSVAYPRTAPANAKEFLISAIGGYPLNQFNDTAEHAEVLAAYDNAIALAKKEEQDGRGNETQNAGEQNPLH